jgi:hypothetical protein
MVLLMVQALSLGAQAGGRGRRRSSGSDDQVNVTITSNVSDAFVIVNGQRQKGNIPLTLQLEPGQYTIQVHAEGYDSWRDTFAISSSRTIRANLESDTYTLRIDSNVSRARVRVDGEYRVEDLPMSVTLPRGTYEVSMSRGGYRSVSRTVDVTRDRRVFLQMEPVSYSLRLRPNVDDAEIYIDGERRGSGRISLELRPGRYSIRISADGYLDFETTLRLDGDETINANLQPAFATIRIKVPESYLNSDIDNPREELRVYVDGRRRYGFQFEVRPGRHDIRLTSGAFSVEGSFVFRPRREYTIKPELGLTID